MSINYLHNGLHYNRLNDLDMVVRSHEVVNSGFELPYANSELHLSPVSEKTPKFFVNTPLNKTKTIKVRVGYPATFLLLLSLY